MSEGRSDTLEGLTLARATVDRAGRLRADPAILHGLLQRPTTPVLEVRDGRALVHRDSAGDLRLVLRSPEPADHGRLAVLLGADAADDADAADADAADADANHAAAAYLGVVGDAEPGSQWRTLREVGAELGDRDAGLFTTLLAVANWHDTHTHCPRCGAPTVPVHSGWVRRCEEDGSEHYPRTDPAVIVAVVDAQDRLLLARAPTWPPGRYSVLAGFVEPGEPLEAAVRREVHEEVGVWVSDVRYAGNQPWPFPSSLMVGFTARASSDGALRLADSEIADALWIGRAELATRLAAGTIGVPPRLSIARALVERWFGGPLPLGADLSEPR